MDHTMNKPPTVVKHLVQFGFHLDYVYVTLWIRRAFPLHLAWKTRYKLRVPGWTRTNDPRFSRSVLSRLFTAPLSYRDSAMTRLRRGNPRRRASVNSELAGVVAVRIHRLHLPSISPGVAAPGFFVSVPVGTKYQISPSRRAKGGVSLESR